MSKAPIPQLLPGRRNMAAHCSRCVFTAVSVHLDGLNAEDKFRVWVTILGHTPLPFPSLYPLVSRTQVTILVNQSMFCSEFSSTLLVPFAVLGTPTEGYQKSGTVRFAILVPFTNSCIPYRTVPNRTAQWK